MPLDLQLPCLAVVPDIASLCAALSSCAALRSISERAFEAFCHQHWPHMASVAAEATAPEGEGSVVPGAKFWRDTVRTALLVRDASAATTDAQATFNDHWYSERRILLVEWLIQVSSRARSRRSAWPGSRRFLHFSNSGSHDLRQRFAL